MYVNICVFIFNERLGREAMKRITFTLLSLLLSNLCACTFAIAPYLQDSDTKVKYVLVRREAENALIMAQDALNGMVKKDMQTALKQLATTRSKVKNQLESPAYTNVYQNFTQVTRDRLDLEEYAEKMNTLTKELQTTLEGNN